LALIAGGQLVNGTPYPYGGNQTEFFDANNGLFYAGPLMNADRISATMTVLINGSILIAGGNGSLNGNTTDLYIPAATSPLP
jgi:hypothetical protein